MSKPTKWEKFKGHLPHLDLWLDIWFLQIRTDILYESFETRTYEITSLHVRLFRRWGFRIRLYKRY